MKPRNLGWAALGLVALAASVVYYAYQRDIRRERERVASGSEVVQTRCGPIEYAAMGDGPAVLIVHGAGGGFDQPLDAAKELAARGFRVVTTSRFGYLRTPRPADASPAAQADAHACLLDALQIKRAAIVGVSAGAPSSMQFALRHPDRCTALVLLVPLAYAPRSGAPTAKPTTAARFMFEHAVRSDFLFWLAMKAAPSIVVRNLLAIPPEALARADAAEQARIARLMQRTLPLSQRQQGLLNDIATASSLARYDLESIKVPTLVISLEDDLYGTFESARYTAQHIPRAKFTGFPTGGHLWAGHDAEVMSEMAAFLACSPRLHSTCL
jgi:2-hydroxy-6-oxonona-2,4-dienedioate hydrolase